MRISREKINKLAHAVADTLAETDSVDFIEDRNTIRQEARRVLEQLMVEEAKIMLPRGTRSRASARPSWRARRSGTSSTGSTTTKK